MKTLKKTQPTITSTNTKQSAKVIRRKLNLLLALTLIGTTTMLVTTSKAEASYYKVTKVTKVTTVTQQNNCCRSNYCPPTRPQGGPFFVW